MTTPGLPRLAGRWRAGWLLLWLVVACCRRASPPEATPVLAAAADGGQPLFPSCRLPADLPCDVRDERCQRELFAAVTCLSGATGAARPPVRFVSDEEARRPPTGLVPETLQRAARRLGLLDVDDRRAAPTAGVGPNAYYSPRDGVVLFVERESLPANGAQAVFVLGHEYLHAIQDGRHALKHILESRDRRTFDQELALWSAVEGEATLYEEGLRALVFRRNPLSWLPARLTALTAGSDDAIARQRRTLQASFATFPYGYGAHWVLATRAANAAAAPQTLAAPSSSREVMAQRHGWPALEAPRCPDASPIRLGPGWPRRARDTLGAWVVQTYVRKRTGDPARARNAARDWRGDWLSIYERASVGGRLRGDGLIWRTCWASPDVASEMRRLIEAQLRENQRAPALVASRGNQVVAIALDDERAAVSPAAILHTLAFSVSP